ncbi:MAG: hypothetical protein JXQ75_09990 [Phycisphaerae bacterium]|nr:hypothetical protein [Phycisphaerae bacterium]
MARQNVGFVDQHIEKVVLGLCAVVLVGAAVFSFGGFRFSIEGRSPTQLCDEAGRQADQLAQAVRSAQPRQDNPGGDEKKPDDPVEELRRWFGSEREGLIKIARLEPEAGRTAMFPPSVSSIIGVDPDDRHHLARIVPPGIPIVTTGRSTFEIPNKLDLSEVVGSGPDKRDPASSTRSWVSVGAQVDLVAQGVNFITEKYPPDSYLTVVKVHLQRKDDTEPGCDWEDVDTYLPFKPPERPRVGESLGEFRRLLDEGIKYVAQTELPTRRSGDRLAVPWVPYLDEPPKMPNADEDPTERQRRMGRLARKWYDLAKKAMEAKTPSKTEEFDAALMLVWAAKMVGAGPEWIKKADELLDTLVKKLPKRQRPDAKVGRPSPDRLMPLVAHDLDVVPGHTYIYRMRYEVLNTYAGITGELENPEEAERLTVFSDWSPVSRPVEPESDVYFFLSKADPKRAEVTVTVYKKTRVDWKSKDFKIKVGDEIGRNDRRVKKADFTTSAVCVDIDFDRTGDGGKTTAMVYLDTDSGILRERLLSEDRKSKLRKKLSK